MNDLMLMWLLLDDKEEYDAKFYWAGWNSEDWYWVQAGSKSNNYKRGEKFLILFDYKENEKTLGAMKKLPGDLHQCRDQLSSYMVRPENAERFLNAAKDAGLKIQCVDLMDKYGNTS